MSNFDIQVDTAGTQAARSNVRRVRGTFEQRRGLHAEIAGEAERLTRGYLRGLNRHKSANRLGAEPTGHLEAASRSVESGSDDEQAYVRIPRSTGLFRAFQDFVIKPGPGRTYLTIPAHKKTYGRRAGEFELSFTILGGRWPALVFTETWELAYWLRRVVKIAQDRTLLPSREAYGVAMRGAAGRYFRQILSKGGAA